MASEGIELQLQLPVPGQGLVMDLGVPARPDSSLLEALLQQVMANALLRRYDVSPAVEGRPADAEWPAANATQLAAEADSTASSAPEVAGDDPLIPEDGAGVPAELASLLAILNPAALDDAQAIDYLKAAARVEAWVQSCRVQALNRFAQLRTGQGGDRDPEGFSRFAPQEISAHLSTGDTAARVMLADARQICTNLPRTLHAMSSGDLDLPRAKALARGSADLPAECLQDFEAAVLPGAGEITLDSVRARARRMRDRLHPESLSERHRRANESRDVQVTDQDDGMAELWIRMSADRAHLVFDRIQSTARSLQGPGEERTLPQLRADVFSDLLLADAAVAEPTAPVAGMISGAVPTTPDGEHSAPAAGTNLVPPLGQARPGSAGPGMLVTMSLTSLLGLSEEPGDLAGYGPIPPDMGRQLSQLAKSWLLVLTDDQGRAIAAAKKLRIPPEWLKRLVRIRDRHCRFPGCRRAARYCEIDHVIAWEDGGWTVLENLQCLCKAHHAAKTAGASSAEAGPKGEITWTTRTGHRKTTFPDEGWDTLVPRAAGGDGGGSEGEDDGEGGHAGESESQAEGEGQAQSEGQAEGEAQAQGEGNGTANSAETSAAAGQGKPKRTLGGIELPDDEDTDPNARPPF